MSRIRKTPEKAVPALRARLIKAKDAFPQVESSSFASKYECIEGKLQHLEESLLKIKNRETMVVDQLGALDHVLDDQIFSFEDLSVVENKLERIEEDVGKLESLVAMVEQPGRESPGGINSSQPRNGNGRQETADHLAVEDKILESEAAYFLSEIFHSPANSRLKECLALLSVFPENKAIKKRPLIYWWIGEGFVTGSENPTAEEVGEKLFQELVDKNIIKPTTTRNSFTVYPSIRKVLIQLAKKNNFLEFSPEETTPRSAFKRAFLCREKKDVDGVKKEDVVSVYNMKEPYLGSRVRDLLSETQKLEVLQMGRWQDSATHHIEAQDYEKLLETLGSKKQLKYVSLRGISRIETLPGSIKKLNKLLILDLKACHNLNKLPEEVTDLRSLTHLDVSECYLLDSMPKGLQSLSHLQVLKGFVVSKSCKINDLAQLPHLKKLSIRMGNEKSNEQLRGLADLKALLVLTISWGVATSDYDTAVSLPTTLVKLDLRSVPFREVPPWMKASELPKLEKLYIKGGKLTTLTNNDVSQNVNFIRLNYLKHLHISEEKLVTIFPKYLRLKCKTDGDNPCIVLTKAGYTSLLDNCQQIQLQSLLLLPPPSSSKMAATNQAIVKICCHPKLQPLLPLAVKNGCSLFYK